MILALWLGCTPPGGDGSVWYVDDFVGEPGRALEYVPEDTPEATPLELAIDEAWVLRLGDVDVGAFAIDASSGLVVDDTRLLPATLEVGATGGGATVTAVGEVETWYGTFPEAVTVAVDGGRWAGTHSFARDVGPIALSLDGAFWELAGYE